MKRILFWAGVAGLGYTGFVLWRAGAAQKGSSYFVSQLMGPVPIGSVAAIVLSRFV